MKRNALIVLALLVGIGCSDPAAKPENSSSNNTASNNNSDDAGNNGGGDASSGGGLVCDGYEPAVGGLGECRSDADCETVSGYCAPGENSACGIPCGAPQQCSDDAGCGDGEVCQRYDASDEPCCYAGDNSYECVQSCTADSCREGHSCEEDGHCRPTSCEAGFSCPGLRICAPDRGDADANGCASPNCSMDEYDCSEGFGCDPASTTPTGCEPVHCDDGYECPENYRCDSAADGHGCAQLACGSDSDCDCGACVNDLCMPFVWICTRPAG